MKLHFFLAFLCSSLLARSQDTEGNFLKDPQTGCVVWYKHTFAEDSVSWSGQCKDGFAEGFGMMRGFTGGKETSRYEGYMQNGKPHGKGTFWIGDDRKLSGNFSRGEILNLRPAYMKLLQKNIIAETDEMDLYDGDNNLKQLYYHAIVPEGKIKGAVVLMPGTWETTEHLISSTQALCESAADEGLVVIALSVNQRLTLNDTVLFVMNKMLDDAVRRYHIPDDKIVMGGWSMGGLFSLRYAELSHSGANRTAIKPVAVFSCDGPCDLVNLYYNFQRKLIKFPGAHEPAYGISEMEKYCGGSPAEAGEKYVEYSCFSLNETDGGNARYLKDVPVRIYDDVDPNWWMEFRGVDMYDMNALDQSAMILLLREMGNDRAEFINAMGKGYRLEGNRHPHSWSIIEPVECLQWILKCLGQTEK